MAIKVDRVSKAYGEKVVLADFSLNLPEQGSVGFMGPSGCGKTTLLRLIAGLAHPDTGRVWGMEDKGLALQFQEDRLLPWRTVGQNLALILGQAEAEAWLERVALAGEGGRYPHELSGGMRRRVALARALGFGGDVILLDEPLKELDANLKAQMVQVIREASRGKLLLVVTHDLGEAEALCTQIVLLNGPPLRVVEERIRV